MRELKNKMTKWKNLCLWNWRSNQKCVEYSTDLYRMKDIEREEKCVHIMVTLNIMEEPATNN